MQRALDFFPEVLRLNGGQFEGVPFVLGPWQQFIVGSLFGWVQAADGTRRFRTAYIEVGKGNGKSPLAAGIGLYCLCADGEPRAEVYAAAPLALDTPVPTPDGWTTQGALRVGDRVFAPSGAVCSVTYLSPVLVDRECFEVELDDGTVIVADAAHRWQTEDTRGQRPGMYKPAVVTTAEIAATLRSPAGRLRHRIAIAAPLECRPDAALPVDPYTLGVWLGDGRANRGAICYHVDDDAPAREIEAAGYRVTSMAPQGDTRYATVRGLRTQLRRAGLLDKKHVPPAYLRAAQPQRLALLQGLMDTDGTCTKTGECRFSNRERRLAEAVHELAIGLGLRASLRSVPVEGAPHWIVSFKAPQSLPVFRIERKRARQVAEVDTRARARYVRDVRPCASVPVRCIEVDSPDHLYLVTRSNVATHNTKKDQAMILFRDAVAMVDQSPDLNTRLVKTGGAQCWNLGFPAAGSFFRAISSDDGQSGPRPHCTLIDEVHEHPTANVITMLSAGQKGRRQPLQVEITNSGFDRQSICFEHHEYSLRVCTGVQDDDQWFGYVCSIDEGDDPLDPVKGEACWIKANPNLGVSIQLDYLQKQVREARGMPSVASRVRRLNFCEWVDAESPWISGSVWLSGQREFDAVDVLAGADEVVGAFDLSGTSDLTALALAGRVEGRIVARVEFWTPGDTAEDRSKRDKVPYPTWIRQGFLQATPGRAVDYGFVAQRIAELQTRMPLRRAAFDPYRIKYLEKDLDEAGVELQLIEHPQGYYKPAEKKDDNGDPLPVLWMPRSIELLQKCLFDEAIDVEWNPVLNFNSASAVLEPDPKNNLIFTKRKSRGRIDGVVALAMCVGLLLEDATADAAGDLQVFFV